MGRVSINQVNPFNGGKTDKKRGEEGVEGEEEREREKRRRERGNEGRGEREKGEGVADGCRRDR